MVKILIYFVCEILFLAEPIERLIVTLCEDSGQGNAKVSCPENKTISLKSILYGEFPCQDATNRKICHSNINTFFNDHCLEQNNCIIPIDVLSNNSCKRPPRRLKVYFECAHHELETTAIAALNITTNNDVELPYLILDTDHRVVIYQHSLKQNQYYICGSEWDDSDATVVCKSINSTWIGNATLVDKLLNIPTLPHSLHCGGLEADVFACNFTESETGCNETKVAGALCCQGTPGRCVTNLSSDDLPQVKSESLTLASIKVIMVSTLVFIIVAALVIIVIVCHRKRKTKNSKPCQIRQNTPANERMDSSDYNVINYNEMTDISIPKINENMNETHTTQHQTQHITTSIEQEDTICNKYESLSTNRNSVEHFYESDSIHTNQYESLTKQREMDKHTYESTEQALPQDIKTSMELDDNICKKYESLSTNRNSVEHTYESDSIHTNQYESLTKQRELDEHTYESTEHALPVSMEQELSQYQSFTNPPESDKNVYASTGSPQ
ncbi:PRSS12 [Mytilus coruscus]|uniref:PRSS12 n=2 Tax=Mytilus coruscus TaxID=42192 RepID=A0A6J8DSX5_MYTCO|nr:PRSS12 [Mytilus coruscus]